MDIGRIIEEGERVVPAYRPAPTLVPVEPQHEDRPERMPERERETEKVER